METGKRKVFEILEHLPYILCVCVCEQKDLVRSSVINDFLFIFFHLYNVNN